MTNEDTPIYGQTAAMHQPGSDQDGFGGDAPEPAPQPITDVAVDPANDPPVTPNTDPAPEDSEPHDEDVDAALGRETEDGPGFGDESQLPAEDFDGFASEDVEVSE